MNADVLWPSPQRNDLTYCISNDFGARKATLVAALKAATDSWSDRVAVKFRYVPAQDATCNNANNNVVFNVNPIVAIYFAAAFYPNYPRESRQLTITDDAFTTSSGGRDLEGIMRHETGHILGFLHEHIHIFCADEAPSGRIVNQYDVSSVMHYPQCRPSGTGGYRQTELDYTGAISLYGNGRVWPAPASWSLLSFTDLLGWGGESSWGTIQYPDVNGDGRKDVCGRSALGIFCGVSSGTSFGLATPWSVGFSDLLGWGGNRNAWGTIRFPDINGDGRADVCGRSAAGITCALSLLNLTFGVPTLLTSEYGDGAGWGASEAYWGTLQWGDVNGDGRQDLCGRAGDGVSCSLSTSTATAPSLGPSIHWTSSFSDGAGWSSGKNLWGTLRLADVNGDGKADVCSRATVGILCATSTGTAFGAESLWNSGYGSGDFNVFEHYWGTLRFPDVNGDGKADVCARGAGGVICATSSGTAFVSRSIWTAAYSDATGWTAESSWRTLDFPDVNGDGKADVCGRAVDGIQCVTSNGTVFSSPSLWSNGFGNPAGWDGTSARWGSIRYVDVTGDGRAEACGRTADGITCAR